MTAVIVLKPSEQPRLRIVCAPHAGGWPSSYQSWRQFIPDDVELLVLQLPGRGALLHEEPYRSMTKLADDMAAALQPYLDRPIVLYGHSFGSVVCYELSRRLPNIVSLNVSGMRAPHITAGKPHVHQMDDAALLSNLNRMGGISSELLESDKLRPYVFNTIRADFEVLETYRCTDHQPIDGPLNILAATDDPVVPTDVMYSWHSYGSADVEMHWMDGGHFYPYEEANAKQTIETIIGDVAHVDMSSRSN